MSTVLTGSEKGAVSLVGQFVDQWFPPLKSILSFEKFFVNKSFCCCLLLLATTSAFAQGLDPLDFSFNAHHKAMSEGTFGYLVYAPPANLPPPYTIPLTEGGVDGQEYYWLSQISLSDVRVTVTTEFSTVHGGAPMRYGLRFSCPLCSVGNAFSYSYTVQGPSGVGSEWIHTAHITIIDSAQTISFGTNPGPVTYSPSGTFTVSATGGASGNPVTFTSTTTSVCTTGGTNGATVTIVTAGTCTIAANQAGNANYYAAPQVTQPITILDERIFGNGFE